MGRRAAAAVAARRRRVVAADTESAESDFIRAAAADAAARRSASRAASRTAARAFSASASRASMRASNAAFRAASAAPASASSRTCRANSSAISASSSLTSRASRASASRRSARETGGGPWYAYAGLRTHQLRGAVWEGGGRRVRGSDARSARERARRGGLARVADSVDGWHEDARTLSGGTAADDRAPRSRRTAPACARPRRRTSSRAAWSARARDCEMARERNDTKKVKKQDVYADRRSFTRSSWLLTTETISVSARVFRAGLSHQTHRPVAAHARGPRLAAVAGFPRALAPSTPRLIAHWKRSM